MAVRSGWPVEWPSSTARSACVVERARSGGAVGLRHSEEPRGRGAFDVGSLSTRPLEPAVPLRRLTHERVVVEQLPRRHRRAGVIAALHMGGERTAEDRDRLVGTVEPEQALAETVQLRSGQRRELPVCQLVVDRSPVGT
jgi:hypothetical protein